MLIVDENTSSTTETPEMASAPGAENSGPPLPWSQRTGSLPIALFMLLCCGCLAILALNRPALNSPQLQAGAASRLIDLTAQMRVNVNAANLYDLQVIPGIGPALARKIIADRTINGAFQTHADLDRVHGIGPRTIEKITRYLVINPPSADNLPHHANGN